MIKFSCPDCNKRMRVGDEAAGRKVKCPRCARSLSIPAVAAVASSAASQNRELVATHTTEQPAFVETDGAVACGTVPGAPRPAPACIMPQALVDNPRYQVLALLGQGGMGAVYKAEHRRMERLVALKVINPALVESDTAVRRFQQEVKAAARLHHAHIVTAFDADQAGSLHFLVMEFVEGQSLAAYADARGPLPAAEACEYIRQAALGLQHAHEQGMVHRDVKPHNLMRTPDGQIKVLDFGLARFATAPEVPGQQLTGANVAMGTPDYIAPEQAGDAHRADIRSDIYSLGCTLYQLLTGQVPYPGGSAVDKLIKHNVGGATPLSALRPDLPAGLAMAAAKMMAKNPADRYQTPAEVVQALTPFLAGNSMTAPAVLLSPAPSAMAAAPRRNAARRFFVTATGVLMLMGIVLGSLYVYRSFTEKGPIDKDASKSASFTGTVVIVGGGKITVTDSEGKEHVLTIANNAEVKNDGKPATLEDIKKGEQVIVTLKQDGSAVATKIERPTNKKAAKESTRDDFPNADTVKWEVSKLEDAIDDYTVVKRKVDPKTVNWVIKPISEKGCHQLNYNNTLDSASWKVRFLDEDGVEINRLPLKQVPAPAEAFGAGLKLGDPVGLTLTLPDPELMKKTKKIVLELR